MGVSPKHTKEIKINHKSQQSSGDIQDEALIWENFKKGNQSALIYIYRNYANHLFNYGCQFNSNTELVRDAVQDIFTELIKSKARLGKTTSIKYYLFKSLRNRLLRLNTKEHQKAKTIEEMEDSVFRLEVSPESILIYRQLDEQKKILIKEKLNELAPLQREALLLYFYEGLGYNQIADILDIKIKSSRALVYRAISALSKLLKPWKERISLLLIAVLCALN